MTFNQLSRRPVWLVILILCAGLLATLPALRRYQQYWLAQQAAEQLQGAADAELGQRLRHIVQLQQPGLVMAVQLLGSPQERIALAAQDALLQELNHWELLAPQQHASDLGILAAELAVQTPRLPRARQQLAADLAARLLAWPDFSRLPQAAPITLCCQRVLSANDTGNRPSRKSLGQKDEPAEVAVKQLPVSARRKESDTRKPELLAVHIGDLPGGGLPIERVAGIALPRALAGDSAPAPATAPTPALLPDMSNARPLSAIEPATALQQNSISAANEAARLSPESPQNAPAGKPAEPLDIFQLIVQLRSGDTGRSRRAEEELAGSHYPPEQRQLAYRLAHADPQVRARWTAALPSITNLDARPWLLWLARDDDPQVRRVAITLLLTSSDPLLTKQALSIARADADLQVQAIADRVAAKGSGERHP